MSPRTRFLSGTFHPGSMLRHRALLVASFGALALSVAGGAAQATASITNASARNEQTITAIVGRGQGGLTLVRATSDAVPPKAPGLVVPFQDLPGYHEAEHLNGMANRLPEPATLRALGFGVLATLASLLLPGRRYRY
jgi:hypothetical protein